ncbi:hypothetical protein ABID92_002095 [Frigoribacterium sp. PvP120]|uniref:hypothetical protein n=1 Tax=unclassified Frigoribacterium TaxID=2627005 RepID=UPI001AE454E2|nr:hypothetical protein [Frigoribacterium sp. PvP121]MBP1240397.1 hypothetical protein [Frigoribacterium sp. PvP121]
MADEDDTSTGTTDSGVGRAPDPGGPDSPLDADAVRDIEADPALDDPDDDAATDDDARSADLDPSEG